jgi:Spy/CpxP family protein refolding chaperone
MKATEEKERISGNGALSLSLIILAVFALIAIASIVYPAPIHAEGFRGMDRSPEQVVSRLKDRLKLTDEQAKAIEPIMRESMAKRRELLKEMVQLRESTNTKINGILTKEQAVEFQKMKDRQRERMRRPAGPR